MGARRVAGFPRPPLKITSTPLWRDPPLEITSGPPLAATNASWPLFTATDYQITSDRARRLDAHAGRVVAGLQQLGDDDGVAFSSTVE